MRQKPSENREPNALRKLRMFPASGAILGMVTVELGLKAMATVRDHKRNVGARRAPPDLG